MQSVITKMLTIKSEQMTAHPVLISFDYSLVLVDTGTPDMWKALSEAIIEEGKRPEEVTALVLTHQDLDHIGCAKDLLTASPKAKIYAHKEEVKYISGKVPPQKFESYKSRFDTSTEEGKAGFEHFIGGFRAKAVEVDVELEDNEIIEGNEDLVAVHLPGHTYGHMCVFVKSEGILIAGDGLNTNNGKLIGANPMHTFDQVVAKESLKNLERFDIKKVMCFHTGLYEGDVKAALKEIYNS